MPQPLLHANITVDYPNKKAALNGVDIQVDSAEIVGLVGGSGCGKSTLALAILRLLGTRRARVAGRILFEGHDLLMCSESEMRSFRGRRIALALQSAAAALNPALRIGTQLREAWKAHERTSPTAQDLASLMRSVELPDDDAFLRRFPGQISVGQAQRVVIAMAGMHRPSLLIVDEPTSALDLLNSSKILELFRSLNREYGVAILYISHDLLSVASLCSKLYVMQDGEIVESGPTYDVFGSPRHAYARTLIGALP
jgi:peptide/nickel transport system ATP-binding protein